MGSAFYLKWIDSAGGPLILMDQSFVDCWKGNSSISPKNPGITDYERACRIDNYIGLVDVGSGNGLVLGDEPMMTSWHSQNTVEGILLRWQWAPNEKSVVNALNVL